MRVSTFHPLPSETDEKQDRDDSFFITRGKEKNNKISLPPPPLGLLLSRSYNSSLQRDGAGLQEAWTAIITVDDDKKRSLMMAVIYRGPVRRASLTLSS